jgi:regulator of protease activity HflC (stomatin/prohibitin superfamily)
LFLKYFLLVLSTTLVAGAGALLGYGLYQVVRRRRMIAGGVAEGVPEEEPIRWLRAGTLAAWGILPLLIGMSISVVPSGMAGVRVSQVSGTRPGTLYAGVHFVKPFIEHLELFDIRDRVYSTVSEPESGKKAEVLDVQAREGLSIGLAIVLRYRLDPQRLDYIASNLPQPVEEELVPPTVSSVFRNIVSGYTVRDVFAAKREEIRKRASDTITQKLGADGIVVKEVAVRDIKLPVEYAKGLEGLLLKEQESDRMGVETEIQQKQVRIAELSAEAAKVQEIKRAEGAAQVRVLQAKAESDAMQYTLPLKEKQIQQTQLESEARKQSTVKNAEAAAEAKVIDSKAELQRRNLLAEAEANRIRVTAGADSERMTKEAIALKQNPLLINKIIAEKLSDKVQIMMVPTDGKFFLTNDLFRGAAAASSPDTSRDPASDLPSDPDDPADEPVARSSASRARIR